MSTSECATIIHDAPAKKATILDEGEEVTPYIIGICGASASGKSTLCELIRDSVFRERSAFVPADCFYKPLDEERHEAAMNDNYNFDHPDAIDWTLMKEALVHLRSGRGFLKLPVYDFSVHNRIMGMKYFETMSEEAMIEFEKTAVGPAQTGGAWYDCSTLNLVIAEGILIYAAGKTLRNMMDLKIYVEADADVRLALRIKRDVEERGRVMDSVVRQYLRFVKPSFENFIDHSKRYADVIIPNHFDPYAKKGESGISNSALTMILQAIDSLSKGPSLRKCHTAKILSDEQSATDNA